MKNQSNKSNTTAFNFFGLLNLVGSFFLSQSALFTTQPLKSVIYQLILKYRGFLSLHFYQLGRHGSQVIVSCRPPVL